MEAKPIQPKGTGKKPGTEPDDPPAVGQADPLSLWLRQGLLAAFGDVAAEPVPADMLRLIEETSGRQDRHK